jgi:hypothetical protein
MPTPRPPERDYSVTPLPKKLGIVSPKDTTPREIALLAAPPNFRETLGNLPPHLIFRERLSPHTTLALCFIRSIADLEATIDLLTAQLPPTAHVWIIRPKTHHKPGFNENHVRDAALPRGLVDYKICSIDNDWSALKFAWRRTP